MTDSEQKWNKPAEEYDRHQHTVWCRHCKNWYWADTKLGAVGNRLSHWLQNPTHWRYSTGGEVWFDIE